MLTDATVLSGGGAPVLSLPQLASSAASGSAMNPIRVRHDFPDEALCCGGLRLHSLRFAAEIRYRGRVRA